VRRGVLLCFLLTSCFAKRSDVIAQFAGRDPSIAFDDRGTLHVAYADEQSRLVYHAGARETIVTPDKVESRGESSPVIVLPRAGEIVIVYPSAKELRAQRSSDGGKTWAGVERVNDDFSPQRSHAFADVAAAAGRVVVSWLDSRSGEQGVVAAVVGSPNVTVDAKTCQCCRTALLAHSSGAVWLAYRDLDDHHVRNMAYAVSRDGGRTFAPRGAIADDQWSVHGCPESGPRLAEGKDGRVWAAWTNGKGPAIEVAAAVGGGRFGAPAVIAHGSVNHPEVGTLPDGRIAVFYEAMNDVVARYADARGTEWSEAKVVIAGGRLPRYARRGSHAALAAMRGKEIVIVEVAP
jgi:hypothetical protein